MEELDLHCLINSFMKHLGHVCYVVFFFLLKDYYDYACSLCLHNVLNDVEVL